MQTIKNLKKEIDFCLNNETGASLYVETLVGIAVVLSVGAGLFFLAKAIISWDDKSAGVVNQIELAELPIEE